MPRERERFGLPPKLLGRVYPERAGGCGSVCGAIAVIKVGAGCILAHSWGHIMCCEW